MFICSASRHPSQSKPNQKSLRLGLACSGANLYQLRGYLAPRTPPSLAVPRKTGMILSYYHDQIGEVLNVNH
jgi:hypothetical protein